MSFISSSVITATDARYIVPVVCVRDIRIVRTRNVFCSVSTASDNAFGFRRFIARCKMWRYYNRFELLNLSSFIYHRLVTVAQLVKHTAAALAAPDRIGLPDIHIATAVATHVSRRYSNGWLTSRWLGRKIKRRHLFKCVNISPQKIEFS